MTSVRLRPWPSGIGLMICSTLLACGEASLEELAVAPGPGECTVAGEAASYEGLLVTAANGEELLVDIRAVPSAVRVPQLGEPTDPARIEVTGALMFSGYLATPNYIIAADVQTAAGMVHLTPGAEIAWGHATTDGVRGIAVDDADRGGAQIGPLTVPCAALSLDPFDHWLDLPKEDDGDGSLWVLAGSTSLADEQGEESFTDDHWTEAVLGDDPTLDDELAAFERRIAEGERRLPDEQVTLRERPGAGTAVNVFADQVVLERVSESGEWMQVLSSTSPGNVTGWIERAELEPLEEGFGFGIGGFGCSHCCGCGYFGTGVPRYVGPARISHGARVFASQSPDSAWATVGAQTSFDIVHYRGSDWVQITKAPGISNSCGRLNIAHVDRTAVTLPEDATYR